MSENAGHDDVLAALLIASRCAESERTQSYVDQAIEALLPDDESDTTAQRPRLPDVFDTLDVGLLLHDAETGEILDANAAAADIYDRPIPRLRELLVGDFSAESSQFTSAAAIRHIRAAANGESRSFDWQVSRPDGECRWVSVTLHGYTVDGWDDSGPFVLAEVHDITEYKQRERRLELLSRIVRHNLRNSMTVVKGHAAHLEQALEDDTLREDAATITDVAAEVGTLADSVSQIEEIARADRFDWSPKNLYGLAADVVESFGQEYPKARATVEGDENVWVNASSGLRFALGHAVENAIVHAENDQPTVDVTVRNDRTMSNAVVRVADHGPRIPQMEVDAIEEAFETTNTSHGTGVGLFVMKWCVESLGGDLTVHENEPRGNVVEFVLPAVDPPAIES